MQFKSWRNRLVRATAVQSPFSSIHFVVVYLRVSWSSITSEMFSVNLMLFICQPHFIISLLSLFRDSSDLFSFYLFQLKNLWHMLSVFVCQPVEYALKASQWLVFDFGFCKRNSVDSRQSGKSTLNLWMIFFFFRFTFSLLPNWISRNATQN